MHTIWLCEGPGIVRDSLARLNKMESLLILLVNCAIHPMTNQNDLYEKGLFSLLIALFCIVGLSDSSLSPVDLHELP